MELTSVFILLITNKVLKVCGGDLAIGDMNATTSINFIYYIKYFVKILHKNNITLYILSKMI
jgi:hypothetical protein